MSSAPPRVAVVSPHLDDAVLSAWLVLGSSARARVVTCFAGLPESLAAGSWDSATGGPGGRSAVELRRSEDRRALARTGSEPVHLDVLDTQYRDPSEDDHLPEVLAGLLEPQLRDVEEVWLPAALGAHPDHMLTRDAALAATSRHRRRYLYGDLPYAGQPGWPMQLTGGVRDVLVHALSRGMRTPTPSSLWRSTLAAVPGTAWDSARLQRLTPAQRRAKYAAVSEYRSQLAALRCGPRNVLRRRRIFAYEVFWALP
jgi:LmbE family N-acetylglucosaminyl deacetylase